MTRVATVRFSGWLSPTQPPRTELSDAIAAPFATVPSADRRAVIVEVDTPPVQRRMLRDLPPMSGRDLRRLVNHQASRFFRMPDSGLVTDAAWSNKDRSQRVAFAVALEASLADDLLAAAAEAGVNVLDIVPAVAPAELRLTLLPAPERARRTRSEWRATARAAIVTCGLTAALATLVVWWRAGAAAELAADLDRLRRPALEVQLAKQQMGTVAAMIQAIDQARAAARLLASRIDVIARALPDSSVLTALTVGADGIGQLSGLAAEPFLVAAQVQRATGFSAARLDGSPAPEAAGGRAWFRFLIRVDRDSVP